MEKLTYYEDLDHGFARVHKKMAKFFVTYNEKNGKWSDCGISFSNFKHDYNFREISKEDALKKTDGRSPEAMIEQHLGMPVENIGDAVTHKD